MEDIQHQVLVIIAIMEEPIAHFYNIMRQDFIEKAIEYYAGGPDFGKLGKDSRNIG
jgi:hypothetical protein